LSIEPGWSSDAVYLRAAQAYMLISMPTGTSTILGVFQVIASSQVWRELHAEVEPRTTPDIAQGRKIERPTPAGTYCGRYFSRGQSDFSFGLGPAAIALSAHKKELRCVDMRQDAAIEYLKEKINRMPHPV
jgi:hypothetical protein